MFSKYQNTVPVLLVLHRTVKFKYPNCINILNIKVILVVPHCIAPGTLVLYLLIAREARTEPGKSELKMWSSCNRQVILVII